MTKATERGGGFALLALIMANVALAFGPLFVRMADTGPVSAGFWRLTLALPVLVIIALQRREPLSGFRSGTWWMLALGGFAFALDLASWNFGIERTKLANSVLFGNMGSVIMVLYGFVISRAWPHKAEIGAVLLAIFGASLLMGASYELDVRNLIGDLFCLAAGVLYVVYLLSIRHVRGDLGSWSVLVWSTVFGIGPMLGIALLLGEPVWPTDWTPVLMLALVCQLLGQGLMVYAVSHFSPVVLGIALLGQPVIASIVGWVAFNESLSLTDWIGMIAIGVALVLVRLPEARRAARLAGSPAAS
ncbi:DMT family transporter [Sphingomonas sp. 35-24ZXX]|uniref:DMT family transporter n=1 Tax=Sphingomonas sp. 35-24ZXX TaxID=1545915 RepID=UPI00053BE6C1|nr:DMT family transporter [Sphingomonas sp. 35-24ZXX]